MSRLAATSKHELLRNSNLMAEDNPIDEISLNLSADLDNQSNC